MNELIANALSLLRGAWRFRLPAIAAAWGVAICGWIVVLTIPSVYESDTRIYLETDSILRPLLNGLAVGTDEAAIAAFVANTIRSRPALERVAAETGLKDRTATQREFDALIETLPKRILVEPVQSRNIFRISFSDSDPRMAQRVVQATVNAFVEDALGFKRADSTSATRFLEQQAKDYETRLKSAEAELAKFKQENVGVMPGEGGDYYSRLQAEMANLDKLRAAYQLTQQKRAEVARQLDGEEPTFGLVAPTRGSTAVDARIAQLKTQLENLLLQYTDKHPEVISIRETIAQLEKQRDEKAATRAPAPPPITQSGQSGDALSLRALDINPVYQATKIALGQADVELVELKAQIASAEGRVAQLRSKVTTIPQVEAQLAQLNRDYEVNKAQYNALLQRLESARLSGDAAQASRDTKFRIIEPSIVPTVPVAPNRLLLASAVLLLAIGAGAGVAVGLNLVSPVLTSRASLRAATGFEVLGTISLLEAAALRWWNRPVIVLGGATATLAVSYVIVIALCLLAPAWR